LAALVALPFLGCATLGFGSTDPMASELSRLEKEQKEKARKEQQIEDEEQRETREASGDDGAATRARRQEPRRRPRARRDLGLCERLPAQPEVPVAARAARLRAPAHEPERAQPLFESALEIDPNSVSAHVGLGLSMLAGGNRDDGLKHLQRAVEIDPKSPKAQAALGVTLDQLGRRDDALVHLEAARALRPHDGRILNNLAVAYLRAGRPDRAEPLLRAALREDTDDAALRANNLGMALAMQGRFDEALASFRQAGDEQSARSNLGYAHYARGEYDQAIAEYEQALLAGGKSNVDVVRNLEAARRAKSVAKNAPSATPRWRARRRFPHRGSIRRASRVTTCPRRLRAQASSAPTVRSRYRSQARAGTRDSHSHRESRRAPQRCRLRAPPGRSRAARGTP
jgi:tetratricopeptide (TPR) repeat protein